MSQPCSKNVPGNCSSAWPDAAESRASAPLGAPLQAAVDGWPHDTPNARKAQNVFVPQGHSECEENHARTNRGMEKEGGGRWKRRRGEGEGRGKEGGRGKGERMMKRGKGKGRRAERGIRGEKGEVGRKGGWYREEKEVDMAPGSGCEGAKRELDGEKNEGEKERGVGGRKSEGSWKRQGCCRVIRLVSK